MAIVFLNLDQKIGDANPKNGSFISVPRKLVESPPGEGVYEWSCQIGGAIQSIYIGRSKNTIRRGYQELFTQNVSTDAKKTTIDTDFIVSQVVKNIALRNGAICYWEHISNVPGEESSIIGNRRDKLNSPPLLQTKNSRIDNDWKCRKNEDFYRGMSFDALVSRTMAKYDQMITERLKRR